MIRAALLGALATLQVACSGPAADPATTPTPTPPTTDFSDDALRVEQVGAELVLARGQQELRHPLRDEGQLLLAVFDWGGPVVSARAGAAGLVAPEGYQGLLAPDWGAGRVRVLWESEPPPPPGAIRHVHRCRYLGPFVPADGDGPAWVVETTHEADDTGSGKFHRALERTAEGLEPAPDLDDLARTTVRETRDLTELGRAVGEALDAEFHVLHRVSLATTSMLSFAPGEEATRFGAPPLVVGEQALLGRQELDGEDARLVLAVVRQGPGELELIDRHFLDVAWLGNEGLPACAAAERTGLFVGDWKVGEPSRAVAVASRPAAASPSTGLLLRLFRWEAGALQPVRTGGRVLFDRCAGDSPILRRGSGEREPVLLPRWTGSPSAGPLGVDYQTDLSALSPGDRGRAEAWLAWVRAGSDARGLDPWVAFDAWFQRPRYGWLADQHLQRVTGSWEGGHEFFEPTWLVWRDGGWKVVVGWVGAGIIGDGSGYQKRYTDLQACGVEVRDDPTSRASCASLAGAWRDRVLQASYEEQQHEALGDFLTLARSRSSGRLVPRADVDSLPNLRWRDADGWLEPEVTADADGITIAGTYLLEWFPSGEVVAARAKVGQDGFQVDAAVVASTHVMIE